MGDIRFLLVAAVLGGLVGATATLAAERLLLARPQPVATVDLAGLMQQEVERLKARGYRGDAIQRYAGQWGQRLDATLHAMAGEYATTLLVSQAVVGGAPDLTGELSRRMQAGGPLPPPPPREDTRDFTLPDLTDGFPSSSD